MEKSPITIFHSATTSQKTAVSPSGDKEFWFETFWGSSNLDFWNVLVSHFVLNIPLSEMKKPHKKRKNIENLQSFYHPEMMIDYFILDCDKVYSEYNKQKILNYFKDYRVILGESRSYNGIDNFNLKGLLFIEKMPVHHAKSVLLSIQNDLQEWCQLDEAVLRRATHNAPILKSSVFLNNERGKLAKYTGDFKAEKKITVLPSNFEIKNSSTIEALCLEIFNGLGFNPLKNNTNGSLSFTHHSERRTPGGFYWYSTSPFIMHHPNSFRSVNIFDAVRKDPRGKELLKRSVKYACEEPENVKIHEYNEAIFSVEDKTTVIEEFLRKKNGCLAIESPMGTGKSILISKIISECQSEDMRCLLITNRISVAEDFKKKYGLKLYNRDEYSPGDSLIVQYDSLWKYSIKFFDVVIIDEFMSLLIHSRSNLSDSGKNDTNIKKLFSSFKRKMVIADAFLSGHEWDIIGKTENLVKIKNNWRDPCSLFNYKQVDRFVKEILNRAQTEKITVSSTSLGFIETLRYLLDKRGIKTISLTADTPEYTRNKIYELFELDSHDKWDVLLFSPTLTVGVSNMNRVSTHFHYDGGGSTDVISSIQMIKRTRKAKEVHLFLKDFHRYEPIDFDSLKDYYISDSSIDNSGIIFEYDDFGDIRMSADGERITKIDLLKNILEFDHKTAFLELSKKHFESEPQEITERHEPFYAMASKAVKRDREAVFNSKVNDFMSLRELDKEEIKINGDSDFSLFLEVESHWIGPKEDLPELFKVCRKDRNFIKRCRLYKESVKVFNKNRIERLIADSIRRGEIEEVKFYKAFIHIEGKLKNFYTYKEVDKHLKIILDGLGYNHKGGVWKIDKKLEEWSGNIL